MLGGRLRLKMAADNYWEEERRLLHCHYCRTERPRYELVNHVVEETVDGDDLFHGHLYCKGAKCFALEKAGVKRSAKKRRGKG